MVTNNATNNANATTSTGVLLLHADGSDGSTTFTDSSASAHTMTANGNAHVEVDQSKFGGSSAHFDGTGDYLSTGDSTDWTLGSGDFTIDMWIYPTAGTPTGELLSQRAAATVEWLSINIQSGTAYFYADSGAASWDIAIAKAFGAITANTWTHLAAVRSGSTWYLFKNGILSTTFTSSATLDDSAVNLEIGNDDTGFGGFYQGYIDDLRIVKGTALWTTNFNPPTLAGGSGGQYVAYLFDEIAGFSDFGSYTGNGAADGPFVWTGFKPRYVMLKRTDTAGDWTILDTARDTYNVASATSTANTTSAEGTNTALDFLSNGFKVRSAQAAYNASGGTYIYAAFADQPFYYSAASAAAAASSFVQAIAFLMGMTF